MGTIRTGEEVAALYRRHVGMVYQICLMLLKNVPDAEDATQTVFQKAMEYDKPFRDPEHEKEWLIVTARNHCKKPAQALVAYPAGGGGSASNTDLGTAGGRGTVGIHPISAREGADGYLSLLLSGIFHAGDGGDFGEEPIYRPHMAGTGQVEAERHLGGERVWKTVN